MSNLQAEDPLAVKVVKAIHSGELEALQRLDVMAVTLPKLPASIAD